MNAQGIELRTFEVYATLLKSQPLRNDPEFRRPSNLDSLVSLLGSEEALMRKTSFVLACAALWLAYGGPANSDVIQAPRMTTASSSSISEVAVVTIEILPKEAQEQVYAAVILMSDDQIRALRHSRMPASARARPR